MRGKDLNVLAGWCISTLGVFFSAVLIAAAVSTGVYNFLTGLLGTGIMILLPFLHLRELRNVQRREQNFCEIRLALHEGTVLFLESLRRDRPGEQLYAYFLEVDLLGNSISAIAATEEGLNRLAESHVRQGYRAQEGNTFDLLRQWLRWQIPAAIFWTRAEGWYTQYDAEPDLFVSVYLPLWKALRRRYFQSRPPEGELIRLCLQALQAMDAVGTFSGRWPRDELVLGIFWNTKNATEEQFFSWAVQVNPTWVAERLHRQLEAGHGANGLILPPPATGDNEAVSENDLDFTKE